MVYKQYICKIEGKLKKGISSELERAQLDMALELISSCASLLYETNVKYVDEDLENALKKISSLLKLELPSEKKDNVVIFYDGFGLDNRGLAQIYLKALGKNRNLIYVTYSDYEDRIPNILKIIEDVKGEVAFIKRGRKTTYTEQITALNNIVLDGKPGDFFFYSFPNDVVATTLMNTYEGRMTRYQVNLTDHAFWLGARCIDYCIEFRDYGASVSSKYRNIPKEIIVKLPFYPELHKELEFQGFPFRVSDNQKVIFSGGGLYKTFGAGNKYYKIVDHILESYDDVIFWYAGSGDDREFKKRMEKYPQRVFLTAERKDLYQVIRHSRLYLSTYPISGGLMYQFAALAGRVPVTLYYDECNDDFLLNQKDKHIEFYNLETLFEELDRLLYDDEYFMRREKDMLSSVTTPEDFSENLNRMLKGDKPIEILFYDIDTDKFREVYLERLTRTDIDKLLVTRNTIKTSLKYTPLEFIGGVCKKLCEKFALIS